MEILAQNLLLDRPTCPDFLWHWNIGVHKMARRISGRQRSAVSTERSYLVHSFPSGKQYRSNGSGQCGLDRIPGKSLLNLTIDFANAHPGLEWFILASGQYAPSIDIPTRTFCPGGHLLHGPPKESLAVTCQARDLATSPTDLQITSAHSMVKKSTGLRIRSMVTRRGILSSFQAAFPRTSVSAQPGLEPKVTIPISTPGFPRTGSDQSFAYAPIGIEDTGDFGFGNPLGTVTKNTLKLSSQTSRCACLLTIYPPRRHVHH